MMPAPMTMEEIKVTQIKTEKLSRVLLGDGWHDVANCQLTYFTVGSSPQTDPRVGIKFKDGKTSKYIVARLDSIQAYEEGI